MKREWKPGDVGMSQYGRVFNTDRGWVFDDDSGYTPADKISGFRPLVVIDPESDDDRDALAKALVEAMHKAGDERSAAIGVYPATVGVALRNLADPKPPRPEEPTGLGAVVEDADGVRWVRIEPHQSGNDAPVQAWRSRRPGSVPSERRWSLINAVRVLSEGVQP